MTKKKVKWLIELREKNKMNQTEFADHLGISRSALCNFERGGRTPTKKFLVKLGKVKKLTLDDYKILMN